MEKKAQKNVFCRTASRRDIIEKELRNYIAMKSIDLDADPLVWWFKEGRLLFPGLFLEAKILLICQATR